MTLVETNNPMASLGAVGKFGPNCEFGRSIFGLTRFGAEPVYIQKPGKDPVLISGIFQRRASGGRKITAHLNYYVTTNPKSDDQKAVRENMKNGNITWKFLTNEQRAVYNEISRGKSMTGRNIFLREFLKSH
jgi:DNA-binding NarL/FixJ family response regulator